MFWIVPGNLQIFLKYKNKMLDLYKYLHKVCHTSLKYSFLHIHTLICIYISKNEYKSTMLSPT